MSSFAMGVTGYVHYVGQDRWVPPCQGLMLSITYLGRRFAVPQAQGLLRRWRGRQWGFYTEIYVTLSGYDRRTIATAKPPRL